MCHKLTHLVVSLSRNTDIELCLLLGFISPVFSFRACVFVCVVYRRIEVPGGGSGLEGTSGGGDPMPISGSWVNRKPCSSHKLNLVRYLISVRTARVQMNTRSNHQNTKSGRSITPPLRNDG